MRALFLIAVVSLGLSACRDNDQADNAVNVDENLAAQNMNSNDVTAIDAVTGDAANMAADVNYINEIDINEVDTDEDTGNTATAASRPRAPRPESRPATNTTADTAANNSTE